MPAMNGNCFRFSMLRDSTVHKNQPRLEVDLITPNLQLLCFSHSEMVSNNEYWLQRRRREAENGPILMVFEETLSNVVLLQLRNPGDTIN